MNFLRSARVAERWRTGFRSFSTALAMLGLLAGCATQKPIVLDSSFWENKQARVGIAVATLPAPSMTTQGNQGLLDIAIAQGVTAEHAGYLERQDFSRIYQVSGKLEELLKKKGLAPVVLREPITVDRYPKRDNATEGYADRDFSSLGSEAQVQYLLFFQVERFGTVRGYYGPVPTSPPAGYFQATGRLIDLRTHQLLWLKRTSVSRPISDPWDQPPNYPNLTVGVNRAVDSGIGLTVLDLSASAK